MISASPLWERDEALARVRAALAAGRNLLLHGPPGVGKTTLLTLAFADQPRRPLWCREGLSRRICGAALAQARPGEPCCLVADPAPQLSRISANAVRELLRSRGMPIMAAAVSPHMEDIGYLSIFFTLQEEKLRVAPLSELALRALAASELRHRRGDTALEPEAVEQLVRWSQGSPGRLLTMLAMAAQPRYRSGTQVKLNLIHLDLTAGPPPAALATGNGSVHG